ncbi:MAG: efflux RND transporter periplasmic adaptor subunit, partial [Porphyromonadaceae bacterium]|nr:efflux RND transporter periplasmic adaptor subunit [Porphyromonadaceae bacterium]
YVGLIYPSVDPATHTFGVEITIPNRNQKLRPGMYAKATIDLGQHTSIVVPTTAVNKQQGSGERYVFVYNGGKVKRHTVEVGRMIDANYEILSGIDAGNVVVTNGSSSLEDGQLVKINPTNKD